MRRALLSLTGIVAGTTLLISLKSAPGASRLPAQVAADEAAAARAAALAAASAAPSGSPGALPAVPTPRSSGVPAASATGAGAATPRPGTGGAGSATKPPVVATVKPSTKPPGTTGAPGTFTGDSQYTEFGYVTVAITVSGGRITAITAVELPSNEPRSVTLSARAEPVLRQRALKAQSSTIDSVSGATYTSEAYRASLQSAIDHAGLG